MANLMPAKTKYRKMMKGRNRGQTKGGANINFGEIGLFAKENGRLTSNQIEAARIAITRKIKKSGRLWLRIFPDKPITKRPPETRMGKGKGDVELYVAPIKRGRIIFELGGLPDEEAREAFRLASFKLPVKTGIKVR
ncbi:MAG: 50S ribosomal protein L16 [bacterium]|nr:50S ribosomal protein L16 [bacterium]